MVNYKSLEGFVSRARAFCFPAETTKFPSPGSIATRDLSFHPMIEDSNPVRKVLSPKSNHDEARSDHYVVTSLRHYLVLSHSKEATQRPLAKNAKMDPYLGGDSVSTEAVAARRHAGTHLPVTWWKLEMPTTTWHLLLN
jgi:hypothetical protein